MLRAVKDRLSLVLLIIYMRSIWRNTAAARALALAMLRL